jgi:hypothetical protein
MIAERVALPEQVGLSTSRLRRLDTVIQSYIERGVIAGAVTLIARKGQIAHLSAQGHMDIAAGRPMQSDSIFRLASMTKPVVSVAILMLLEEGKLLLTDPVSAFVPGFKNLQVAVPNATLPSFIPTQLAAGDYHRGSGTAGTASGSHHPGRLRAAHGRNAAELSARQRLGVFGGVRLRHAGTGRRSRLRQPD